MSESLHLTECANLFGGLDKARAAFDKLKLVYANTANKKYVGPGLGINPDDGNRPVVAGIIEELMTSSDAVARSVRSGYIFVGDLFLSKNLNDQAVYLIHELKHINGAGVEIDDYERDLAEIRTKCQLP